MVQIKLQFENFNAKNNYKSKKTTQKKKNDKF